MNTCENRRRKVKFFAMSSHVIPFLHNIVTSPVGQGQGHKWKVRHCAYFARLLSRLVKISFAFFGVIETIPETGQKFEAFKNCCNQKCLEFGIVAKDILPCGHSNCQWHCLVALCWLLGCPALGWESSN